MMKKGVAVFFVGIAIACAGLALFSLANKNAGFALIGMGALMMIAGNA